MRLGIAGLFLAAACVCLGDMTRTVSQAGFVFQGRARAFAWTGVAMMLLGGVLLAAGGFPGQLGALILAAFLAPAAAVHLRQRDWASVLEESLRGSGPVPSSTPLLRELGSSAASGHLSLAFSNLALIAVLLGLAVSGGGELKLF